MTNEQDMARHSREMAGAYDRWAPVYDTDVNATRDLDAVVLRSAPLLLSQKRVLEIGCGTGKNTEWLVREAAHVTALDFSAGMLARARERVATDNIEFAVHYIRAAWPVEDGSVDLVICNLVLEHVENLAPVFAEAARVLTSGGHLFICELHPYRQLRGGQAHFADPSSGNTIAVSAYRHTTSEYVNAAIAAGLALLELGEWSDEGAGPDAPPRLLSLLCKRDREQHFTTEVTEVTEKT
jgi:ubiquinone/menaquinone biosynthesis C-methylase UbiE